MPTQHQHTSTIQWTGNKGTGTDHYRNYESSHEIVINNKATIEGSSDPAFLGDATKHNPEDLLVSSLASCHMLWYLHVCAAAEVIVTNYLDHATGTMTETANGSGRFTEVILNPIVTVTEEHMIAKANELHEKAKELCFIANSVNFPVRHEARAVVGKLS